MHGLIWGNSGLRDGATNRALDREQWLRSGASGEPLLRFYACTPTASLGTYEDEAHALRPDYCCSRDIPIIRRLSGGSALYIDSGQICWTLTVPTADIMAFGPWLECLGIAICGALSAQGVAASFREPNDIELEGRKLGSFFLAAEAGVLLAQGTLFQSLDVETMLKVLRVPKEKLTPEGFRTAAARFAVLPPLELGCTMEGLRESLANNLGAALGLPCCKFVFWPEAVHCPGDDTPEPNKAKLYRGPLYSAFVKTSGGVLMGHLRFDEYGCVASLRLHGNVQMRPRNLFNELEGWLLGVSEDALADRLDAFFYTRPYELFHFGSGDILILLHRLFERLHQATALTLSEEGVNTIMVHDPEGRRDTFAILAIAEAVLVPYCAKPVWCKWRHRDGCSECGLCTVSDTYRLAHERGLQVVTICNFEHLNETLQRFREEGVGAYLGMCCNNFFLKREYAFRAAGMPAVLLDITGSNCYDLGQEQLAYVGKFQAEASLNECIVEKVMQFVPHRLGPPDTSSSRNTRRKRQEPGLPSTTLYPDK